MPSTAPAPSVSPERTGLLIVGHGTRDQRGCAEFDELFGHVVTMLPDVIVEGCFLELVEPDLLAAAARAIERGASRVAVVPLLLVSAGHAKRDIPHLVATAAARFPQVEFQQMPHLGAHGAVLELARRRYQEALATRSPVAPQQTMHLIVGRGTKDPEANAALCSFARERWQQTGAGWLETCFLAMTQPLLERALELVPRLPFARIVVEPHLLFRGELLDRVGVTVAAAATSWPATEFIVTNRLGPDPSLAEAIVELAHLGPRLGPSEGVEAALWGENYEESSSLRARE